MSLGIYCYIDKKDNKIVYVGKDSYIHQNKRHKEHHHPSRYKEQVINTVLQNNPNRYTYQVLAFDVKDQETLNKIETMHITHLKPRFNFTDGGEGTLGFIHTEEHNRKVSEARTKKNARVIKGGFDNGKQMYILRYNKTNHKRAVCDKKKLEKLAKDINRNGGIMEKSKPIVDLFQGEE